MIQVFSLSQHILKHPTIPNEIRTINKKYQREGAFDFEETFTFFASLLLKQKIPKWTPVN